jgi:hypothetical protein
VLATALTDHPQKMLEVPGGCRQHEDHPKPACYRTSPVRRNRAVLVLTMPPHMKVLAPDPHAHRERRHVLILSVVQQDCPGAYWDRQSAARGRHTVDLARQLITPSPVLGGLINECRRHPSRRPFL